MLQMQTIKERGDRKTLTKSVFVIRSHATNIVEIAVTKFGKFFARPSAVDYNRSS